MFSTAELLLPPRVPSCSCLPCRCLAASAVVALRHKSFHRFTWLLLIALLLLLLCIVCECFEIVLCMTCVGRRSDVDVLLRVLPGPSLFASSLVRRDPCCMVFCLTIHCVVPSTFPSVINGRVGGRQRLDCVSQNERFALHSGSRESGGMEGVPPRERRGRRRDDCIAVWSSLAALLAVILLAATLNVVIAHQIAALSTGPGDVSACRFCHSNSRAHPVML